MKDRPKRIRALSPIQQRARELRQEMTPAEKLLWQRLRNRQLAGLKFRRQHPLDRFIVDFYCAAARLIVEIDGPIHDFQPERDSARTAELEQKGYRLIRFQNEQVLNDLETVLTAIQAAASHPPLSQTGEGEEHHPPLSQPSEKRSEAENHPSLSQTLQSRPEREPEAEDHLPLSRQRERGPGGEGS
jgi:very-short-patch-repair endonuclease